MTATYKAYAIRYGSARDRLSEQNFMFPPVRGAKMPLDYYFWVLQGDGRNILVDAAFTPECGLRRGRPLDVDLVEVLAGAGLTPADFSDVIITHLHFDHTGFLGRFPHARVHLQRNELTAAVHAIADHPTLRWTYEPADIQALLVASFEGRVRFYDGDTDLFPGIRIHLLPGHSPGQAAIAVETQRGKIMLAVDVAHFYANLLLEQPFIVTDSFRDTLSSYRRLRELQPDINRIIVGHDPKVRVLYPPEMMGGTAWHPLHLPPVAYEDGWLTRLDDYACD
ncbi:N-acyl homoserine lactonase family protein [Paracoccus sp. (in: a-proteobacteria)]|uniref:N-acyl homoserine lactonase family protein n=1 Tax=Paracoccus sp. TaxID=267 RepID=UPI002AFFA0BB|nr:N-acyl homoserine lactonase family protein [Paracoccus sp. (in: a-proteobacteria)]